MTSGQDIKSAQETYNGFVKAAFWGTGFCALVVIFVVGLIAS
ncbi:aa3-type cytochrome c oxidase subunit IV [Novosphingobium sp. 1949]|uniref:Aa3-type cytochrome c oxidase subunit IV n=1 Tax=Novosphingobium organovorum TaxID=2930092 RepID=A0ABT0B814_9SPHN|nr:aa3-type cytochrome c oxidase subunit IV [Novosphingobium organovorum]MCJ2181212.1 aa3-type cytochrome c oxidase subunit IV [Novosphingobium organovorum]